MASKGIINFVEREWIEGKYFSLESISSNLSKEEIKSDIGLILQEYQILSGDIFTENQKNAEKLREELKSAGYEINLKTSLQ